MALADFVDVVRERAHPLVLTATVVVPTYNEQPWIRDCLASLLDQTATGFELLVIDGGSTDDTRAIVSEVAAGDARIRLVDNPGRTAAAAMNVALELVETALLIRADAHAVYAPDFVAQSLRCSAETGAANVGPPMRSIGVTRFGRAVAAVTGTKIGMGTGAFHWTSRRRTDVDTVWLGCFRTEVLRELGGWAEDLQWAAEDQELNYRLRRAGHQIVCDPAIRATYFPRSSAASLWDQYRNYGICKAWTVRRHGRTTVRALVPAAFVAGAGGGIVAWLISGRNGRAGWIPLVPAAAWLITVTAAALGLARRAPGVRTVDAAAALGICHIGHGVGFWTGVVRILRGLDPETCPEGHR